MDVSSVLEGVSRECLRGRPAPAGLARLWQAELVDDSFPGADLELLESLQLLDLDYGAQDTRLSGIPGARARAHQDMFKRLGFFAADADGGFLAFHLDLGDPEDPPVLQLDAEGQYRWLGAGLGEALVTLADEADEAGEGEAEKAAKAWLKERGISTKAPLGVDVEALPDLSAEFRKAIEAGCDTAATPKPTAPVAGARAAKAAPVTLDPLTWIGASARRVEGVLSPMLPAKEKVRLGNWLSTDEKGKVKTVWLTRTPGTEALEVKAAKFGMSRAVVLSTLGPPSKVGAQWVRYDSPMPALHLEFKDGAVVRMTLMSTPP